MFYGKHMDTFKVVMEDEQLQKHAALSTQSLRATCLSMPQPIDAKKLGELAEVWGVSKSVAKQILRDDYAYLLRGAKTLKAIHGEVPCEHQREPISTTILTTTWLIESLDAIEV